MIFEPLKDTIKYLIHKVRYPDSNIALQARVDSSFNLSHNIIIGKRSIISNYTIDKNVIIYDNCCLSKVRLFIIKTMERKSIVSAEILMLIPLLTAIQFYNLLLFRQEK